MPTDLATILPLLLPDAIEWANARSQEILTAGEPLSETGLKLARAVGVSKPKNIRVSTVRSIPLPEDEKLREVALETGLLGEGTAGLTLGYGIYVCTDHIDNRLISHECRHVFQYDEAGSIEAFLPSYLAQIAIHGYHNAPYEIDARMHEIDHA
jgi:hypothetical protein